MAATQLIDIAFVPLYLTGIEPIDASEGSGYGQGVIHADYTHALVSVLVIALISGWLASRAWGKRGGITIGAVVFSHWVLDLLVHRADLPILPGNFGDLPLLGFGLWRYPFIAAGIELLLVAVGFFMYARSVRARSGNKIGNQLDSRPIRAWTAIVVMGILLVLSLVTDVFGI